MRTSLIVALIASLVGLGSSHAEEARTVHGLSLLGVPKYGPDFPHFDYVNPDAPKGGTVTLSAIGGFDSLNPFIVKGESATGLGLTFDTLMTSSLDEASTEYGLVAESVTVPDDFGWVEYTIRPEARFHDGTPVTVDDVIFSFETLKAQGAPFYRYYYANVVKSEAKDDRTVRFTFDETGNRELPQIVGQLPILPKHFWDGRTFDASTLDPILGSGAYRIKEVVPNRRIVFERVPDYWAANLPVAIGHNNFDEIRYEYFRDLEVAHEAFKSGAYDFKIENSAKRWAIEYDFPAARDGRVKTELLPDEGGAGMQAWAFNTRRAQLSDPRVRQALAYAFDFEFANKTFFYDQYVRTRSFFEASELAATGLPSPAELAILEPYRDKLPPEVFTTAYEPPSTAGRSIRANLRTAAALLRDAGWTVRDGKLVNSAGAPFTLEFLLGDPSFERITGPLVENLRRLGIEATVRTVDSAQYTRRIDAFDFDVIVASFRQSLSPGNEQRDFWGSAAADRAGSRNVIGIKDPVVDALIDRLIFATDRDDLIVATRALDRVLQWGHYVIPQWHLAAFRIAYWDKFDRPDVLSPYTPGFPTVWWYDAEKAKRLGGGN